MGREPEVSESRESEEYWQVFDIFSLTNSNAVRIGKSPDMCIGLHDSGS